MITTLATDIERHIYNESDPSDVSDLTQPLSKRSDKAKTKWLIEVNIHLIEEIIMTNLSGVIPSKND